jgi:hypothetical protein
MAGEDQVREVEEVGMGCCLVNTRVFHRIGRKLDWQCFLMPPERESVKSPCILCLLEAYKKDTGYTGFFLVRSIKQVALIFIFFPECDT